MKLQKAERNALQEFELTPEKITEMVKQYMALTVPAGDNKAYRVAREALTICVHARTGIDKHRKKLGEDARIWINECNAAGKELTALIEPAETHLSSELGAEDARKAAIADEIERKEQERINGIRTKINAIAGLTVGLNGLNSVALQRLADELEAMPLDSKEYMELSAEANITKTQAYGQILVALDARITFEKEEMARKIEADRLEQQRKEQEAEAKRLDGIRFEQDRIAKEAQDKIDAERLEMAEARAKFDADRKAEQDRIEFETVKAMLAEQAKIQAEAELKARVEREETARLAKIEADKKEAAQIEALKSDKEKLTDYTGKILAIPFPKVDSKLAVFAVATIEGLLSQIREVVESL
ncbi:hypothetical protein KKA14_02615 [bacterium]|nr:hypothetical protein [bacterium]